VIPFFGFSCIAFSAQAREGLTKEKVRWNAFLLDTTRNDIQAHLEASNVVWMRSLTTKYETLCGRAILNSKNKRDRVTSYTIEYTMVTKMDPAKQFFDPLWREIQVHMK
jgi:hypothetical protein